MVLNLVSRLTTGEGVALEVRAWMARKALTQQQIAVIVGESQPWVSDRLRGRVALTVDDAARFADALRVPLVALIQGQQLPHLDSNQEPAGKNLKDGNPWVTVRARYDSSNPAKKDQNLRSAA